MQNYPQKSALSQSIRVQAATFLIAFCMFSGTHAQTPAPAAEPSLSGWSWSDGPLVEQK